MTVHMPDGSILTFIISIDAQGGVYGGDSRLYGWERQLGALRQRRKAPRERLPQAHLREELLNQIGVEVGIALPHLR